MKRGTNGQQWNNLSNKYIKHWRYICMCVYVYICIFWMFLSPQTSHFRILLSKVILLQTGTFGMWLLYEGSPFMHGISTLDCSHEIKRRLLLGRKVMTNLDSIFKSNKGPSSQGYGFSSSHVWMWELDCEEGWAPKNWCFCTVVLEKTLESPLDCKKIQPVPSEGDQPWDFFGRTDAKAGTPVLWPPNAKSWLIGKESDAGRDWGQEEKGATEVEMADWPHWLNGCESECTPGVGDGQGDLAFCNSWGHKKSDTTEQLNWIELMRVGP